MSAPQFEIRPERSSDTINSAAATQADVTKICRIMAFLFYIIVFIPGTLFITYWIYRLLSPVFKILLLDASLARIMDYSFMGLMAILAIYGLYLSLNVLYPSSDITEYKPRHMREDEPGVKA